MYSEQLDRASNRHQELLQQLAQTQERQHEAQQVIDAYDHPLRRRLHRSELDHAQVALRQAGFAIERQRTELAEIEARLPGLRSSVAEAQDTLRDRPILERERHGIRQQLGKDLDARKDGLAADPADHVIDMPGPRPERDNAAGLWDEAAARIDQHRSAFDLAVDGQ
jgi:chromosome segregation ATPase